MRSVHQRRGLPVLLAVVMGLLFAAVAGCGDDEDADSGSEIEPALTDDAGTTGAGGALPDDPTTVDILGNPDAYDGELVTITGPVQDVIVEPGAFTIGEQQASDPAEQQIIVFPTVDANVPGGLAEGDQLRITGTVDVIAADVLGDEEFLFEADAEGNELIEDYIDQPAIVASLITEYSE